MRERTEREEWRVRERERERVGRATIKDSMALGIQVAGNLL